MPRRLLPCELECPKIMLMLPKKDEELPNPMNPPLIDGKTLDWNLMTPIRVSRIPETIKFPHYVATILLFLFQGHVYSRAAEEGGGGFGGEKAYLEELKHQQKRSRHRSELD